MYCERCKNNEATIHLSEIIKDIKSEVHLCEQCARDVGLNTKISNFTLTLPEMLTFLNVDEVNEFQGKKRCEKCGCDFIDYKRNGKLGCPDCYIHLADQLEPVVFSYHGDVKHCGKFPAYNSTDNSEYIPSRKTDNGSESIQKLQAELDDAVRKERYEDAAMLRDRIKEIKNTMKKQAGV